MLLGQDEGVMEQSFNAAALWCGAVACSAVHNGMQSASDFEVSFFRRAVAVLAARASWSWRQPVTWPEKLGPPGALAWRASTRTSCCPLPLTLASLIAYRPSSTGVVAPPIGQCFVFFGHVHTQYVLQVWIWILIWNWN